MRNIFDSHAHYDDSQFDLDREELLGRGLPAGWFVASADNRGPSLISAGGMGGNLCPYSLRGGKPGIFVPGSRFHGPFRL